MGKTIQTTVDWGQESLIEKYPLLSIRPSVNDGLTIEGRLIQRVEVPGLRSFDLDYRVRIKVRKEFPEEVPVVWEEGGKILKGYHKMEAGNLCLGSPLRTKLILSKAPDLVGFIEKLLLPYLANHRAFESGDELPFGELEHGIFGVLDDYIELFQMPGYGECLLMLRRLTKSASWAKNQPCPCGSQRKMRQCHQKVIAPLRKHLSHSDFRVAVEMVDKFLAERKDTPVSSR